VRRAASALFRHGGHGRRRRAKPKGDRDQREAQHAAGRLHDGLQCQAQVPFSKEAEADRKPTLVTLPSLPLTIRVEPEPEK